MVSLTTIWAIGQSASASGISTVLDGFSSLALSPIKDTPQNTIVRCGRSTAFLLRK